jgi:tetratricopeptide (TPR) repeat protein
MPNPVRLRLPHRLHFRGPVPPCVLWLLCALCLPQSLWAEGSEPPPAPLQQPPQQPASPAPADPNAPRMVNANAEVTRARQLFQERKFAEAAQALQRAYAFDPNPLFLFNAGQAYRKAEQRKEALEMYQRYLEVDEKGPLAAEARGYVSDLQAFLKAQERLQDAQVELETKESQSKKTQEALKAEKERSLFMEQALKKETNKPFYKKSWFYAVAGIGGFLLLAGIATVAAVPARLEAEASLQPSFNK